MVRKLMRIGIATFCLAFSMGGLNCFFLARIFKKLNTKELDKLLEDAPSPFIMQHAGRISGVRKRVRALNTVLKSIQRRIDNMDRMLSAGLKHETLVGESSGQQHAL